MKKKLLAILLLVNIIMSFTLLNCLAEDEIDWRVRDDNILIICGEGEIPDYGRMYWAHEVKYYQSGIKYAPWRKHREDIKELVIDKGVTRIGAISFDSFTELEVVELPKGLKEIGNGAFFFCKKLKEIELPSSLEVIGGSAFSKTALETIYIPENVNTIGGRVFDSCKNLREIIVDEDNETYASEDGVLYSKDLTVLHKYPEGGKNVYTLLPSVETIEKDAFAESHDLLMVDIPLSIKRIEKDAFYRCNSLKKVRYEGSREQWLKIGISTGNDDLKEAEILYNCEIDFKEPEDEQIILTIGETKATVFGEEVYSDVAPKIHNDRTMLPARFVAEKLGADVMWSAYEPEKIVITNDTVEIIIYINSETAYINGKETELDSAPFVENDRTYTPVRFIVEALGATAEWNNETRQVIITK